MNNIYNSDGSLTSGRLVNGNNFPLTFVGLGGLNIVNSESMIFQAIKYVKIFSSTKLELSAPRITLNPIPAEASSNARVLCVEPNGTITSRAI